MCRFYGWTDKELCLLSLNKFNAYFMSMNVLEAQENRKTVAYNLAPNWKKSKIDSVFNNFKKTIGKYTQSERITTQTLDEIVEGVKRKMNG